MESNVSPMNKAHAAPRCTAKSKRTGERCKGPAVKGWSVCRFHGARGGHGSGKAHPAYKHGLRTRKAEESRKLVTALQRQLRDLDSWLKSGADE
ncbi:Periplasmic glucans biosynthesis protein [Shimia thalassica]|uniref:Periplasmic glucans biosynthesis protein n=1 Tax=Shimia thalassica TaxID=1715693 RepID=A0A0P1IEC4_9RHOB|nr:Periplasmic glucans biosynthesis protein [Shimia thalassica]